MGGSQLPTGTINCLSSHPSSPGPTPCHPHQVTPNNLPCLVESLFQEKQGQGDLRQAQGTMMHGWSAVKRECAKCHVITCVGGRSRPFEWHLSFRVKGRNQRLLDVVITSATVKYNPFASGSLTWTQFFSQGVIVGHNVNGPGVWWPRDTYTTHTISNVWAHVNCHRSKFGV